MSPCFVFLIVITTLTVTGERQYSCTQFSAQNTQLYPLTYTPHSSLHHNHNCTFLQLSTLHFNCNFWDSWIIISTKEEMTKKTISSMKMFLFYIHQQPHSSSQHWTTVAALQQQQQWSDLLVNYSNTIIELYSYCLWWNLPVTYIPPDDTLSLSSSMKEGFPRIAISIGWQFPPVHRQWCVTPELWCYLG